VGTPREVGNRNCLYLPLALLCALTYLCTICNLNEINLKNKREHLQFSILIALFTSDVCVYTIRTIVVNWLADVSTVDNLHNVINGGRPRCGIQIRTDKTAFELRKCVVSSSFIFVIDVYNDNDIIISNIVFVYIIMWVLLTVVGNATNLHETLQYKIICHND